MSIKYAYLGPAGTFTEAALLKISEKSDQLIAYANVTAALNSVRNGECQKALVPIENSVEGVVARTLDELAIGEPLVITAETTLPVTFSLMSLDKTNPNEIKSIATHPHAEAQCRSYIAKNFPYAQLIETSSTAAAAKGLSKGDYDAAIAAPIAAKNYGLKVLAENIGDNQGAVTRFVVVEKPGQTPAATGKDRTSLAVFIDIDHAGALLEILNEFAKHQINLTFIQSRPTGIELGHYHFIIDVEGHIDESGVSAALVGLKQICDDIRFLGSYPQAK
jgi:prephenate dehydratase